VKQRSRMCYLVYTQTQIYNIVNKHHYLCGPGAVVFHSYSFTPPLSYFLLLSFSIFYFSPFSFLLHLFSCFFIPSHSTRIVPLCFQAGCLRRRLSPALFFSVDVYFLVKDACLFFVVFDLLLS